MALEKQMELFDEGGLLDEGGTVDEESGNDVPVGSLKKEVRDDVPAMLSEGEFVMPADVVRYHGLDKMMALRDEAKMGLQRMEAMGQMGNAEEAILPDDVPFGLEDLDIAEEPMEMQVGGFIQQQQPFGIEQQQPIAVPFSQQPQITPVTPVFGPGQPVSQPKETFTFSELMPTVGGTSETREYRNADGESLFIPFINGEPIYPIPEGYFLYTPKDVTPDPTPAPVTVATQPTREEDPSDGREFGGGPAGLTMSQSQVAALTQLDPSFAGTIESINKKYPDPGIGGLLSPLSTIISGFKKNNEISQAVKGYDYDALAKDRGLSTEDLKGTLNTFGQEIYSGYRDPETGTVSGQKDMRSLGQIASEFMNPKTYDDIDEFGNIAPDGTMPITTGVATSRVTEEGTAGQVAQENVDVTRKVAEFESLLDQAKVSPQEKVDFLNDIIAGKSTELNLMDRTGNRLEFNLDADLPTLKTETMAAEILRNKIQDDMKPATSDAGFLTARPTDTRQQPTRFEPIDTEGVVEEETRIQQTRVAGNQRIQEAAKGHEKNYVNKGYSRSKAKTAGLNKAKADEAAKQQRRDRGETEANIAKTSAVTDSSGKAVTSGSDGSIVTSGPQTEDSGPSKIVCTEMYRQTQLDDWKEAIKIWGVYEKKYLTPYHEKGYHWLFMPWVNGMRHSTTLTSIGAYLAMARTQHLKHIMTKGKAPDSIIGNVWCKIVHPIVYVAGRTKEWLKL